MKPDQQSNYWQHDPEAAESEETASGVSQEAPAPEMYVAESVTPSEPASPETPVSAPVAEPAPANPNDVPLHWTATEYIHHEKNRLWFTIFGLVVVALIALDLLFLKSYTFTALVIVMAIAIIIYSRRPPRTINYTLSPIQGLYLEDKLYPYSDFKAFGVVKNGEHHSLVLIPTKRFAPGVTVYFPETSGEGIVDILGARLPMETLKLDIIDIVVSKLRL